jgi:uncharacterized protein (DUF305 family)
MLRMLAFIVCVFALYSSVSSGNAAPAGHDRTAVADMAAQPSAATQNVVSTDVDAVFVQGMIVHHKGAIDMAKVELQYGTDPELKQLAARIIATQTSEVAQMKEWLAKHGK